MPVSTLSTSNCFVTHLESAIDGTQLDADSLQTLHDGRPIWVRYDLEQIGTLISRDDLMGRSPTLWRYDELLPNRGADHVISLGEGMTPVLDAARLGAHLGIRRLSIKDESQLPTGSFKSRGMAMAITMANYFGIERVALPSAGNAGGAAAAYAARAGMECYVFMPEDTPVVNQYEAFHCGAHVYLVDGLITDCGRMVHEGQSFKQWFDLSTLKEPYRIEGKKTMGLELAEQCNWKLPDVIVYPTGGGTGLIGMWKAFNELKELGWLDSEKLPRMISVQSTGCAPIVKAFESGERFAEKYENAESIARGIRVPAAVGDFMILDAVKESGGRAVSVEEERICEWMTLSNRLEGISVCPEAAACVGAVEQLVSEGEISSDDKVVVFNTGGIQKYMEAMQVDVPRLSKDQTVDWSRI